MARLAGALRARRTILSGIGVIVGSGFDAAAWPVVAEREALTPFGPASGPVLAVERAGDTILCLARHGPGHRLAPHEINYRANVWALHAQGARRIVSLNAVGAIAGDFEPGGLAVPEQLIDYTWGRESTFGGDEAVRHLEFTEPFEASLRAGLAASVEATTGRRLGGTYAVTQGPRLETAAEIDRLERDGCTMVGMTAMPEAALAAELGMAYAVIAFAVNRAAGRGGAGTSLQAEIGQHMRTGIERAAAALDHWLEGQHISQM